MIEEGCRYEGPEAQHRRNDIVIRRERAPGAHEYVFSCGGELYLTQPRMRGADRVRDVYCCPERFFESLCASASVFELADLPEDIREKIVTYRESYDDPRGSD